MAQGARASKKKAVGGERRDACFWIDNASVEWKESQAPFFTVVRLTLEPRSRISGACARPQSGHRCRKACRLAPNCRPRYRGRARVITNKRHIPIVVF